MNIVGVTPTIQINLLGTGSLGWGTVTNNNFQLIDSAFNADRTRILALENVNAVLPLAIVNRVGHNLLRNNIFQLPESTDPARAVLWTPQFLNGASGYTTRDSTTYYAGLSGPTSRASSGRFSQRISIVGNNQAQRSSPFPNMKIYGLDAEGAPTLDELPNSDERQLLNGFGYVYQPINLSPNTLYTLSGYGKAEIPNAALAIDVSWKLGIVFKNAIGTITRSHFTSPQTNSTSSTGTDSFDRTSLTFVTPDLPQINAEVWLVCESNTSTSIGSSYFDGIQLEQASSATFLETFSMRNGSLFVDGDLTVGGSLNLQQDQLVLATNKVILAGDVQLGSMQGSNLVNILDVYTKIATFYGPMSVKGSLDLGDDPTSDIVKVRALSTRFYSDPPKEGYETSITGGNVTVDGKFIAKGDVSLGSDSTRDVVTINATLVTAQQDITVEQDLVVKGSQVTYKSALFGAILEDDELQQTSRSEDRFVVYMDEAYGSLGSDFYGDVRLHNTIHVTEDAYIGSGLQNRLHANVGSAFIAGDTTIGGGLEVSGPTWFDIGSSVEDTFKVTASDITFDASSGSTIWNTQGFDLSGSLEVGSNLQAQSFKALVGTVTLGNANSAVRGPVAIYSTDTNIAGNTYIAGAVTIGTSNTHNLTVTGSETKLGTGLGPSRPFAQFITNSVITNDNNQPAHSGTVVLGDAESIKTIQGIKKYQGVASIYAGTTYIGHPGSSGLEARGDLQVGGNIVVGGSATVGNSIVSDEVSITAKRLDVAIGSGSVNIGGTYNPAAIYDPSQDQGGLTITSQGHVATNGQLTIKGPIVGSTSLTINALQSVSNPIEVYDAPVSGKAIFQLSKEGVIDGYGGLYLGPTTKRFAQFNTASNTITLGNATTPASSLAIHANTTTTSSNLTVGASLTVNNSLTVSSAASVSSNLTVGGNIVAQGNITSSGISHNFGSQDDLGSGTSFNIIADTTTVGVDGDSVGNLIVANDLSARHSVQLGTQMYTQPAAVHSRLEFANKDITSIHAHAVVLDVGYDGYLQGEIFRQTAGLRIGGFLDGGTGGYQNRIYNSNELYHGGVTIDAYGNIYADGSVTINGNVSHNSLELTAPNGTPNGSALLTLSNDNTSQEVFKVDNLGNISADGYITTQIPSTSTLSAFSVTVGDGQSSFGDFNLSSGLSILNHNTSTNPIQEAINYLVEIGQSGTVFIKKGLYILSSNLILPLGISLLGEGDSTILQGQGILVTDDGSKIENLQIRQAPVGITTTTNKKRISILKLFITACTIGIELNSNESIICNNYIVDNTLNGVIITGSNNIVNTNIILRNPT